MSRQKRIFLVTATRAKTDAEFKKRPICRSIEKFYNMHERWDFDFDVVKDNKEGLSTVYNRYLTEEHKNDIVLFVHDDLIISDLFLVELLRKSPYTVTGLAGSTGFNPHYEKAAWHLMSPKEKWVGEVRHIKDNRVWTTTFGNTTSHATLLDGLFLAVDVEEILKTKARFNEEFAFHHYDISFCFECTNNKVKKGILPISVIHYGLGDSMISKDWEESNEKFKKTYYHNG